MVSFNTTVQKFAEKGEKSGWTYIEVTALIAHEIKPNTKKSFRVKGFINDKPVEAMALLPMGNGNFIITLSLTTRKKLTLKNGDKVSLLLTFDETVYELNKDLVECLNDAPLAATTFYKLPRSHQNYYSKWIEQAKTIQGISNRISKVIDGLNKNLNFAETIKLKG